MTVGTLSANRFNSPSVQFCDAAGAPYAAGKLYFYVTATSTPLDTYSDPSLDSAFANTNPVVLDSAGRAGAIFLEARLYKVVLKDSSDNTIWTQDPVSTSDMTTFGKFQTYAGNPNGNVAGTAGSGTTPSSVVWDRTNNVLYVCTTTGVAAAAVWTVANAGGGSTAWTADISPAQITASQNNYDPTGLSTATVLRLSADTSGWQITGLAGGSDGRIIVIMNIGTTQFVLVDQSGSSSAANQFVLPTTLNAAHPINPKESVILMYDSTVSKWKVIATGMSWAGVLDMESPTTGAGIVTPFYMQYHPGVAKFTVQATGNSTTILISYNMTSWADTATGQATGTIATDFSSANWIGNVSALAASGWDESDLLACGFAAMAAGTFQVDASVYEEAGDTAALTDPTSWLVTGFGDQIA